MATNQTRLLPNELTDAELVEAIHYLDRNRNLTPAEAILAMHVDEQLRRLYGTESPMRREAPSPQLPTPASCAFEASKCAACRSAPDAADPACSTSELTDAVVIDAIRYWQTNRSLDSADAIMAMHVEEFDRRLAVSAEVRPLSRRPQHPKRTPSVRPALFA